MNSTSNKVFVLNNNKHTPSKTIKDLPFTSTNYLTAKIKNTVDL